MTQPTRPPAAPSPRATAPARQASAGRDATPSGTLQVTSEQLFAGAAEVQIDHRGALYRLKQTSLGKLILTK